MANCVNTFNNGNLTFCGERGHAIWYEDCDAATHFICNDGGKGGGGSKKAGKRVT